MAPKHVVILGAGFGGLPAARALRRAPVRVTLIDRRNHHLFQPLLYQVATAALSPSEIAAPIRSILRRQKNTTVVLGEVRSIDTRGKVVILSQGEIHYDFLIVATGATHSYLGHDEWAEYAPGLKSIEDALEIRRRVLLAYEAAELEPDPERRQEWLTFVIVGAGPTGVELAGALAEISRHTLARDFRNFDPTQARILLLEALPSILPSYPPVLCAKAKRQLARLGVEVRTGARVTHIGKHGVSLGDVRIGARTVLWCAGVAAPPLARSLDVPLDRAGRVLVRPELTLPGLDDVFVIGDLAAVEQDGGFVPGVAPAAVQEGRHAGQNIVRSLRGQAHVPFRYRDRGSLATIGRAAAVAHLKGFKLSGLIAWLAWLAIHIFWLIGFRNRFIVMLNWAYSYLTFRRAARLITGASPANHDATAQSLRRSTGEEHRSGQEHRPSAA
jgi:NADH dehydrogenase